MKDCTKRPEQRIAKLNRSSISENLKKIKSLTTAPITKVTTTIRPENFRDSESILLTRDFAAKPKLSPMTAPSKMISARLKTISTLALTRSACRSFP